MESVLETRSFILWKDLMAFKSIGAYVTVAAAGTPARCTSGRSDPTARLVCHTLFVQQHASNTGKLYLLDRSTGDKTTGVGVLATVPAPTLSGGVAIGLPWVAYTIPYAPGGGNAADYYLDADISGDKATVSIIVA